jgi:hypothetical protein
MANLVSQPGEIEIFGCKAEARQLHLQKPGFGSDLNQIKGGRLCLYLLLDLDY